MINNNNIYKLIKKAKDDNVNTTDPILKIIQHPITFIYSFTLNAQNEPIFEEELDIPFKKEDNQINDKKDYNKEINNNNKDKNIVNKDDREKINKDKFRKINDKEKILLNKKRELDKKQENIIKKQESINKPSKIVKNKIIHEIYNSKNINLWENESSSEEKNDNILPIHKQIEFINKCKNEFSKYNIEKKSEYDKDLDKGRIKKIHKNKISFKKHKNYFQKISNKHLKNQYKFTNNINT